MTDIGTVTAMLILPAEVVSSSLAAVVHCHRWLPPDLSISSDRREGWVSTGGLYNTSECNILKDTYLTHERGILRALQEGIVKHYGHRQVA